MSPFCTIVMKRIAVKKLLLDMALEDVDRLQICMTDTCNTINNNDLLIERGEIKKREREGGGRRERESIWNLTDLSKDAFVHF